MRPLALAFGLAYAAASGAAGFLMVFVATFPFENQTPEAARADDWLVGVGVVVFLLATATFAAIVVRRAGLAAVVYTGAALIGLAVLRWSLRESDHSDGKLLAFGLAIEFAGFFAVVLAFEPVE